MTLTDALEDDFAAEFMVVMRYLTFAARKFVSPCAGGRELAKGALLTQSLELHSLEEAWKPLVTVNRIADDLTPWQREMRDAAIALAALRDSPQCEAVAKLTVARLHDVAARVEVP